ncbi:hypothetical protein PG993_005510 [Apiospora rasikravindrae]|uniref:Fungal N-terminal domain-containing protein n=1 Tax=Apiospora rasikravindrae TaxID=990691 RepID=A0ABR1THN8_9PEZI
MADLAASAAGLISLGLQVTGGIAKYLDAVKCRDEELSAARQQNALLRDTLATIENATGRLNRVPLEVIAVTKRNFESFRDSLTALESFVAQLASCNVITWRSRLKDKTAKLRYAFDRPKLEQLCVRVRQAHCSLQLAIDGLGLFITAATHDTTAEVQHRIPEIQLGIGSIHSRLDSHFQAIISRALTDSQMLSEKLDLAGETSQASFNTQQEYLEQIQGQGSDIFGKVAGIEQILQTLLLTKLSVNDRLDDNVSVARTMTRLVEKPAVLRECCDMIPLQNTLLTASKLKNPCVCGRRKKIHRKYLQFGPWYFYNDLENEGHLPSCPISRKVSPNVKRQYGFRYNGLARVIKAAVGLSFVMSSGAGGWSLGPSFHYYPTVDGSRDPAFQIIRWVFEVQHWCYGFNERTISVFQQKALAKMTRLFARGKTSPLAVTACNASLMHGAFYYCAITKVPAIMKDVVQTLILHGVPPISYDIKGGAPGFYAIRSINVDPFMDLPNSAQFESLALIAEAEGGVMPMTLSSELSRPPFDSTHHNDLARSPSLAEACGCGPLSMAILAKDIHLAQSLLGRCPTSIEEVDSFGDTPLHFAAALNLLPCLPSLLPAAKAAGSVIQQTNSRHETALYTAMRMSTEFCGTTDRAFECAHCSCCDSLVTLLEAGALVCGADLYRLSNLPHPLPLRAWRHFISQLKAQRENLKILALRNTWAVENYLDILQLDQVLDLHAFAVYKSLQTRGIDVPIYTGLTSYWENYRWLTVFDYIPPHNFSVHDLAFQLGFRDIDSGPHYGYLPPLCRSCNFGYINWLLQQGADLKRRIWSPGDRQPQTTGLTSAHYLLHNVVPHHPNLLHASRRQPPDYAFHTQLQIVTRALSGLADDCWCACSTEGCTPFIYLLKSYFGMPEDTSMGNMRLAELLDGFSAETMKSFYLAAMRFAGFSALDLTHTCCNALIIILFEKPYQTKDRDEVEEIQQEESRLIGVLDEMVDEFEDMTADISGDSERFQALWEDYWDNRVPEILQELEGIQMTEAERQDAKLIGVMWESDTESDDPTEESEDTMSNPYDPKDIDYWYYELDSIAEDV